MEAQVNSRNSSIRGQIDLIVKRLFHERAASFVSDQRASFCLPLHLLEPIRPYYTATVLLSSPN